ncbi:hypothetical protein IAQ61_005749, partial [Plenodomus lingam]
MLTEALKCASQSLCLPGLSYSSSVTALCHNTRTSQNTTGSGPDDFRSSHDGLLIAIVSRHSVSTLFHSTSKCHTVLAALG